MSDLHIGRGFSLPLEAVTQSIGILAKRRAGKSYTARRMVEQLLRAGQQVVVVDPKGDWWGIRSSADAKGPGFPIVILGGEHGDVNLEAGGGEVVAKLVVEERVSIVLDLSSFRKGEVAQFMGGPMPPRGGQEGFLESLYRLKARERFRTPMMLTVDESDAIAPQKPQKGEERMLGAAEDIVRRGGQRGIGSMLITQRSAVLNKNVLTQMQVLMALRTIAPQDLEALKAWIDVHGTIEEGKTLMSSLPSLPVGEAWVWSPGWPTTEGIFQRVKILPIETFDSGATPEPGKKPVAPKNLADVDLAALKRQMAATIEKAKQDDPRLLRAEIAHLKAELTRRPQVQVAQPLRVEVPVVTDKQVREFAEAVEAFGGASQKLAHGIETSFGAVKMTIDATMREARRIADALAVVRTDGARSAVTLHSSRVDRTTAPPPSFPRPPRRVAQVISGDVRLKAGMRRMLESLARVHPQRLTRDQVGTLAGITRRGGTFSDYYSKIGVAGLIDETSDGTVGLTSGGVAAVGGIGHGPPSAEELQTLWAGSLKAGARRMLEELIRVYPEQITRDELGERAGITMTGGTFSDYLSKLRANGLAVVEANMVRADDVLFMGVAVR